MRRKQCEITERAVIDRILGRATIGRLATVGADGYPYITPVNYVYLDGAIYFHCARVGEKLANIERDPRVCFTVDIPLAYLDLDYYGDDPQPCLVHQFYHCVIIRGRAEYVQQMDEKVRALNRLVVAHEPAGRQFPPITEATPAVAQCQVVAVRIESISGKSDLAQKKDEATRQRLSCYLHQRNQPGDAEAARLLAGEK
jgi:nitroimidazol reductase NimA-like FMN-containing flavoprotein (pyridoxamine 5'-phosphate oxidase superfamily)